MDVQNTFKRYLFLKIIFYFLFSPFSVLAQISLLDQPILKRDHSQEIDYDSIERDSVSAKKNFLKAGGGVALVEVLPWSYSYFIKRTEFAKISFKSVGSHLKLSSWTWDDDQFTTNQFSHPYHGNLYFNSFRANGYNMLPSALATVSGSLIWEIAGESEPPSINDLINTSFGGVVLGEMTHRLANKFVNNRSTGLRRKANEIFGLLINPMNGFNRIISGKWGKVSSESNGIDSSGIDAQFDLGVRRINTDHNLIKRGNNVLYGRMRFLYQDRSRINGLFDEFSVDIEVGIDDSALVNTLSVYGLLYGQELLANSRAKHSAILSANYDLFHNSSFFYGGQSINMNLVSEFKIASNSKINTTFGIGSVLLAAVPDQYKDDPEHRNYDYGSGLSLMGNMKLDIMDRLKLGVQYTGGIVGTVSENHSSYSLHSFSSELSVFIWNPFSINMSAGFFTAKGNYRDHPNIKNFYSFGRVSVGYQVSF
jgi:hypothetical protein